MARKAPYMGCSIQRTRSGRLSLRFRWTPPDGIERNFSRTTTLADTPDNRRTLRPRAKLIGAEIRAGRFSYAHHFTMPRGWWEAPAQVRTGDQVEPAMLAWIARAEKRRVRPSRVRNYRNDLRNYIVPRMGTLMVEALTNRATLEDFQVWLVSSAGQARAGVSEKTAANVLRGTVRAFLRDAHLDTTALDALRWERYVPKREEDPFTAVERDRILVWYQRHRAPAEWVLYRAAFDSGMRPSELLGLDVRHFDRATGSFAVRQSRYGTGAAAPTKTRAAVRTVPLSPAVAGVVADLAGVRPPGVPLFPLRYNSLDGPWRRCLAALGIRHRGKYQTKHTYAVLALLAGESPAVVAAKLGISLATLEKHYAAFIRRGLATQAPAAMRGNR